LSIDSQEGRGSTFTCHFPPERLQAAEHRADTAAAAASATSAASAVNAS
jgi:hypothetical protein